MTPITKSDVESAALGWLSGLGYAVRSGADIAPEGATPECGSYGEVLLGGRRRGCLTEGPRSRSSGRTAAAGTPPG